MLQIKRQFMTLVKCLRSLNCRRTFRNLEFMGAGKLLHHVISCLPGHVIESQSNFNLRVGTFDPMPNTRNEKLASLNMDRIRYWLSVGARPSRPVAILFGLAGILPPHPHSLVVATKKRQALAVAAQTLQQAEMDKEVKEELVGSPKSKDNDTNHKDP